MVGPPSTASERRRYQPPGTAVDKIPVEVSPAVVAQCKASAVARGGSSTIQTLNQSLCEKLHASKNDAWVATVQTRYYYTVQRRTENTPFLRVPYDTKIHPLIQRGLIAFPLGTVANKKVTPFTNPENAQELSYMTTMQANQPKVFPHHFLIVPSDRHEDVDNAAERVHADLGITLFGMSAERGTNFAILDRRNLVGRKLGDKPAPMIGEAGQPVAPFYTVSLWPKGFYARPQAEDSPTDAAEAPKPVSAKPAAPTRHKQDPAMYLSIPKKDKGYYVTEKPDPHRLAAHIVELAKRQGPVRGKSVHIVFAVDNSSSVRSKRKILQQAVAEAAKQLRQLGALRLRVGIVFFCDERRIRMIAMRFGGSKRLEYIEQLIRHTKMPKGCREVEPVGMALKVGLLMLESDRGDINQVAIFTDRDGIGDDHAFRYKFEHGLKDAVRQRVGVLLTQLDDPKRFYTEIGAAKPPTPAKTPAPSRPTPKPVIGQPAPVAPTPTRVRVSDTDYHTLNKRVTRLRRLARRQPNAWAKIIPEAVLLAKEGRTEQIIALVRPFMLRADPALTACKDTCLGLDAAQSAAKALSTMGKPGLSTLRTIVLVSSTAFIRLIAIDTMATMGADGQAMLRQLVEDVSDAQTKAHIETILRNIPK